MDGFAAAEAVATVRAGIDALLSAPLTAATSTELTELLAELEVQRRRLEAVDQVLVAETVERGVAGEYARTSPADLLVTLLRITPAEAKARVGRARDVGPRRAFTGEALTPILPTVAGAVRAGEISTAHTAVITRCLAAIPGGMPYEVVPVAERMLVEAARHEHPGQLAKTALLLLARIDPDGAEPRDREIERRREFTLIKNADGTSRPRGYFTAELTAAWEAILDSLAAPVPAQDGLPDDRTPGQRRHDALADAALRLIRSDTLPAAGGVPVTILATTTLAELIDGVGFATTGHGDPMPIPQLLQIACDGEFIPVIFNDAGGIVAFGRGRRLASRGQRLVLVARDGGCSFPGCDRPAAWTEVHHILPWNDGGHTDIDNMCLLCRYHHREFERRGWQVTMAADGMPEWIPPAWIDPDRKPMRNRAHHLTDFDFSPTRELASA